MSSSSQWLSDALRDPALAGAASVLLRAMHVTGGDPSPSPPDATAGEPAALPQPQPQPQLVAPPALLSPIEILSHSAKICEAEHRHPAAAVTPVLTSDAHAPAAVASPNLAHNASVAVQQANPAPAPFLAVPEADRGWVAREEGGEGAQGRGRKRASPRACDLEPQAGKRGRDVLKVVPKAGTANPSSPAQRRNSLQDYFGSLLSSRGYSSATAPSAQRGYSARPTPLQRASYGTAVLAAVRRGDGPALRSLLSSGLSPNPCTAFSEDVLHMTCKRGEAGLVRAQLDAGANVRIADDLGRTPLHHAAWAGHLTDFGIVEMLLDVEPDLLRLTDAAGWTPLQFVSSPDQREAWRAFLMSRADKYWPPRPAGGIEGPNVPPPPAVSGRAPDGALKDPAGALPVELAKLVAAGEVSVEKVARMRGAPAGAPPTVAVKPPTAAAKECPSISGAVPMPPAEQGADYFNGARLVVNRSA